MTDSSTLAEQAVAVIRQRAGGLVPRVALVLGSGLGGVARLAERATVIPYAELPGFPVSTVESHAGRLILGHIGMVPVAVMQGRFHMYEGHAPQVFLAPIRALRQAGCETFIVTNAAGALRREFKVPGLMLIHDHINGFPGNPLVGPNDERFGPRFPDMSEVYDRVLTDKLRDAAKSAQVHAEEGVYFGMLGPVFETPAEVRAIGILGGDSVGMSTVPEAIVARHAGMKIAGISVLTNYAAGITDKPLSMQEVVAGAAQAEDSLVRLLSAFFKALPA